MADVQTSKAKASRGKAKGKTKGKGKGDGKDEKSSLGKGKGKGKAANCSGGGMETNSSQKQDAEAAQDQISVVVVSRRPKGVKHSISAKGQHCEVNKHSGMGCAVIRMDSTGLRNALMSYIERMSKPKAVPVLEINGVNVQVRRHRDKGTNQEVMTDLFAAWGHKAEKDTPLSAEAIAEAFDEIVEQVLSTRPPASHSLLAGQLPSVAAQQTARYLAPQVQQVAMMQQYQQAFRYQQYMAEAMYAQQAEMFGNPYAFPPWPPSNGYLGAAAAGASAHLPP